MTKLEELAEIEGFDDFIDMLEEVQDAGSVPCICTNEGCSHVEHWEPDCNNARCSDCNTDTMMSCIEFMIAGDL
jgi:hypothetical protein